MEGIIWLFMLFLKLFGSVRPESVSFYFSAYENRELYSRSTFIGSTFAEDIMLCARGCGAESDCNTANYNSEENKCELFKERMENISHGAAMITTRGYYLLTKVEMARPASQEIKDPEAPTPEVKWLHYTPQWCTKAGRVKLGEGKTADECKEMCKEGCPGVEWWQTYTLACYKCTDPAKKEPYTYTNDRAYPPHVFLKSGG